jgi:hypothetical protein
MDANDDVSKHDEWTSVTFNTSEWHALTKHATIYAFESNDWPLATLHVNESTYDGNLALQLRSVLRSITIDSIAVTK